MGCNTSKDSFQPAVDEAKEDSVKNGEQSLSYSDSLAPSRVYPWQTPDQPISDCHNQVTRNYTDVQLIYQNISKAAEDGAARADSDKEKDTEDEKEKEAAATKIQAVFRGHCARKSLKQPSDKGEPDTEETEVSTKEQLEKEFPLNDKELFDAATKIQATFRGHMSRKEQAASAAAKSAMNMVGSAAAKIEEKMQDAVHELEGIDLADPDLHKAATKIQASFRGHKVRQEVSMHCTADESKK